MFIIYFSVEESELNIFVLEWFEDKLIWKLLLKIENISPS